MIGDEKQYEFLTNQLNYHNDKIIEGFNQFIKLISAIIAGSIWIITQQLEQETKLLISKIIPSLILIISVSSIFLILINLRSWWGYRKAISSLIGAERVPPPKFPRSCSSELVMILVIIISTLLLFVYLPI